MNTAVVYSALCLESTHFRLQAAYFGSSLFCFQSVHEQWQCYIVDTNSRNKVQASNLKHRGGFIGVSLKQGRLTAFEQRKRFIQLHYYKNCSGGVPFHRRLLLGLLKSTFSHLVSHRFRTRLQFAETLNKAV